MLRAGGPLTVTDLNFLLRSNCRRSGFHFRWIATAAERRLTELAAELSVVGREPYWLDELAAGLLRIANANMASAIRTVTIAKGADPADYVLVAFGGGPRMRARWPGSGNSPGAGHPDAGVLSARGIGLADVTRHGSCGVEQPLDEGITRSSPIATRRAGGAL